MQLLRIALLVGLASSAQARALPMLKLADLFQRSVSGSSSNSTATAASAKVPTSPTASAAVKIPTSVAEPEPSTSPKGSSYGSSYGGSSYSPPAYNYESYSSSETYETYEPTYTSYESNYESTYDTYKPVYTTYASTYTSDDVTYTTYYESTYTPPSSNYGSSYSPPSSNYGSSYSPPSSNYGSSYSPPSSNYGSSYSSPPPSSYHYTYGSTQVETNYDSWSKYNVDTWYNNWYNNYSQGNKSLSSFYGQYVSSAPTCYLGQSCDLMSSWNTYATSSSHASVEAYMVLTSYQNLHDMFNYVWQSYLGDDSQVWSHLAEVASSYHSMQSEYTDTYDNSVDLSSCFWAAWSHYVNTLANGNVGYLKSSGYMGGFYGIMQAASKSAQLSSNITFGSDYGMNVQATQQYYTNYVSQMRSSLQSLYSSIFDDGYYMNEILSSGCWVDRSMLNLDCQSCVSDTQNWLVTYFTTQMVNYLWRDDNVFITYMPYGQVAQQQDIDVLSSDSYSPEYTNFCYDDCMAQAKIEGSYTYCYEESAHFGWNGWGPGMARLVWYNPQYSTSYSSWNAGSLGSIDLVSHPPMGADGSNYGSAYASGYQSTWNWNVNDIITSSVGSYDAGGYNYNGISAMVSSMTSASENDYYSSYSNLWDMSPSSSGWWNLPVCIIKDWNMWPSIYGVDSSHQVGYSLCQCMHTSDMHGTYFPDAVGPSLSKISTHYSYSNGGWNTCSSESWGPSRYIPPPSS